MPSGEQLKELVSGLKTRSPQEVMGTAATSSLLGSIITAAGGLIGLMVAMTVLVFVMFGPPQVRKKPADKPVASALPSADKPAAADSSSAQNDSETTVGDGTTAADDPTAVDPIEAMGIGETKDPDAKPKSMENRIDDILKDLE